MAFISAQADIPGASGRGNYTVARAQRDVFGRSNVAVMGANRRFDGVDQGSVSTDAKLSG
jgi:hypothetical protein